MNIEDLLPPPSYIGSEEDRIKVQKQIENEREQARIRQEQDVAKREAQRLELDLERQQRPYPVRLVEQRCLTCHSPDVLVQPPRSLLNWALVVQRMYWLNGAPLQSGDTQVIAQHLAQQNSVTRSRLVVEYLALTLVLLAFLALIWQSIKMVKRIRGKA